MPERRNSTDTTHLLDLKELLPSRETKAVFDRSFPLSYEWDDVQSEGPVRVTGTLTDYSGVLQFQAEFSFPYTAVCARCLVTVERTLTFSLDRSVSKNEDEEETVYAKDDVIDLAALSEVGIDEHLPLKHLCSDDCRGLCPMCGAELNKEACSCKKPPDPRLAGLAEFFNE